MKLSKLLQSLLFGMAFMKMGIGPDDGGGAGDPPAGDPPAGDPPAGNPPAGDPPAGDPPAGGKKPTDEEARLLKEVMQKKDALKQKEADLAAAQERLKQFDGIDPAAVRKLLDDQKTAETAALEAKGEWDRLKARMSEEHTSETKTLKDQIAHLQSELGKKDGVVNELSVGSNFSQSKFISDEMTMTPAKARIVYGDHFDLEEGKVVGYDKPRGATNRTALVDSHGNAVAFDEALRKIVEADPDKDHLLKSKVKPGAGSSSNPKVDTKPRQESPTDSTSKIAAGLKNLNLLSGSMK